MASLFIGILLLTACTLNPTHAPVYQRDSSSAPVTSYRVKAGDTLFRIAWRNGLDYRRVAAWNKIRPPYTIYVGQKLILFNPDSKKPKHRILPPQPKPVPTPPKSAGTVPSNGKKISDKSKKTLKIAWRWPLKGVIAKKFSPPGSKGIDITGKLGQPVYAAAAGKVVYSGQGLIGYGNLVIIKHSEIFLSAYANNRRLRVREGEEVGAGQVIAEVGAINGKRPSLHFEIRKNGQPDNPLLHLPRP